MRNHVSRALRTIEDFALRNFSFAPFRLLATLIALFDLRGEAKVTTEGRARSRNGDPASMLTQLRRDIHRMEKGMIMRPRRIPFGKDYVSNAVNAFVSLDSDGTLPREDRQWAVDVISHYLTIMDGTDEDWLGRAREEFLRHEAIVESPEFIPFLRETSPESPISSEQFRVLAERRRSVRWFLPKEVDQNLLDQAVGIAGQSPSACNRQNIRFSFFSGEPAAKSVLDCAGGTKGFSHQVPCVGVVIGKNGGYRHTFDRHAIFIDGGLASMAFQFALETMGISSCCINWPDVASRNSRIRKIVDIDPDETVLMLIAIGYADPFGAIPSSRKRGITSLSTHTLSRAIPDELGRSTP